MEEEGRRRRELKEWKRKGSGREESLRKEKVGGGMNELVEVILTN